ncbi:MAG: DUF5703 domain-containing protein [Phycisphaerae bacterium]
MNRATPGLRCGLLLAFLAWAACGAPAAPPAIDMPADRLEAASPAWSSPGLDGVGSVPMGNGRVGLNAWVEGNADLVLLLSHTDSFSECERLLKLGRIRIAMEPPLDVAKGYRQRLDLERGLLRVEADGGAFEVVVDAASPTVMVRVVAPPGSPRAVRVRLENWRTQARRITGDELKSSWLMQSAPDSVEVREGADEILDVPHALAWQHRNRWSMVPFTLDRQGLAEATSIVRDPLIRRTFGGRVEGEGFARIGPVELRRDASISPATIRITLDCRQTEEEGGFAAGLAAAAAVPTTFDDVAARTGAWWRGRWDRSFVFVEPPHVVAAPLAAGHPWRIGVDSEGGNRFEGEVVEAKVAGRAMSPDEVAAWSSGRGPGDATSLPPKVGEQVAAAPAFRDVRAFTAMARVRPARAGFTGRIIDSLTAGRGDGMLLDLQAGRVRAIVGAVTFLSEASPPAGVETAVAATFDAERGFIRLFLDGRELAGGPAPRPATTVSEAYAAQRFMTIAATGGEFPVKFNGSIFTVLPRHVNGASFNEDFRAWGGSFWWQNTRLPYHGMLARGDGDRLDSLLGFYARQVPLAEARARVWHGVKGAWFPETMTTFGSYANGDYGWQREGHAPCEVLCPWWCHAWNQGPELVAMMLDQWDHEQDRRVLEERTLPTARAVLSYFDSRFGRDASGRLVISPSQSLETYWTGVVNDLPTVAGLREVTARLCALPADIGSSDDRALWARVRAACPSLPLARRDGATVATFQPAEQFSPARSNCENPELMAVWPFGLSGVGRGLLEEGRATFERRLERMTHGWTQDGQQAARLGLADEAARILLAKVRNTHPSFRFTGFWGPNFDWLPDQCHGGNLMTTLQEMLLQTPGRTIIVCPALPRDWSGVFRLHAPLRTTVTARVGGGVIERLEVDPPARRADVVAGEGWVIAER